MTIEGKDSNLSILIPGIGTLALVANFAFEFYWLWILIGMGSVLLYFIWKTSKFKILVDSSQILITRHLLGINVKNKKFNFDSLKSQNGSIIFKNKRDEFKFHFERKCFDTVEIEYKSKFYQIGTEENAVRIINELKKKIN